MNLLEKIINVNSKTQKTVTRLQGDLTTRNIEEKSVTRTGYKVVTKAVTVEKHKQKTNDYSLDSSEKEYLNPNSKDGPEFSRTMEKENSKDCCRCCGSSLFWSLKNQNNWICGICHPPAIKKAGIEWRERNPA